MSDRSPSDASASVPAASPETKERLVAKRALSHAEGTPGSGAGAMRFASRPTAECWCRARKCRGRHSPSNCGLPLCLSISDCMAALTSRHHKPLSRSCRTRWLSSELPCTSPITSWLAFVASAGSSPSRGITLQKSARSVPRASHICALPPALGGHRSFGGHGKNALIHLRTGCADRKSSTSATSSAVTRRPWQ